MFVSKAVETDYRRQFQDAVKAEEKNYRSQRDEISKLPKVEQRDAVKKLKQDRTRNIALLAEQFKNTIDDHLDQQNVSVLTYLFCVLLKTAKYIFISPVLEVPTSPTAIDPSFGV